MDTSALLDAASQGNSQLVQLLVESNANPEISCNLGDTPASVAYSNDYTELCDWLESITSSSSLDKDFTKPSYLCIAGIFGGIELHQCGKGRHILYVIINTGQMFMDKEFSQQEWVYLKLV